MDTIVKGLYISVAVRLKWNLLTSQLYRMHMFQLDKHEMIAQARPRNSRKNCQSPGAALIRVFLETKI